MEQRNEENKHNSIKNSLPILVVRRFFLRWASRFASLASGYPLHHLLALRTAQVVPLLSLSLRALPAFGSRGADNFFGSLIKMSYFARQTA
jgi:hypothetical protein